VAELYTGVLQDMLQLSGEIPVGEAADAIVKLPVYRPTEEAMAMISRWVELGEAPPSAALHLAEKAGQITPEDRTALEEIIEEYRAERARAALVDVTEADEDEDNEDNEEDPA
jgi:hypothetical protein